MPTFYCVRHGAVENPDSILYGRLQLPLSATGIRQAEALAGYFADKDIHVIYSSAVRRCQQTSDIIAHSLGIDVVNDRRLLETLTPIQGMHLHQVEHLPNSSYEFLDELGGESMLDQQIRMLDFLWEKVNEERKNIVICSHGDPLYFLYCGLVKKNLPILIRDLDKAQYHPRGSVRPIQVHGSTVAVGQIVVP